MQKHQTGRITPNRPAGRGIEISRPLERVEIDEIRIDPITVMARAGMSPPFAHAVKPEVRLASGRFLAEMREVAWWVAKTRFAAEVRLLTDADVDPVALHNAKLIAAARRDDPRLLEDPVLRLDGGDDAVGVGGGTDARTAGSQLRADHQATKSATLVPLRHGRRLSRYRRPS